MKNKRQVTYDSSDFEDDDYADECWEFAYFLRLGYSMEETTQHAQETAFLMDLYQISWDEAVEKVLSPN